MKNPTKAATAAQTRLHPSHVLVGVLVLVLCLLVSTLVGAGELGVQRVLGEIVAELTGGISPLSQREAAILWQLRAPRVVLGALVGAALSVSGAAYQGVFRNPLADPYLLGSASGAGLAVTLLLVAAPGAGAGAGAAVPLVAFVGAVAGVSLAWLIGRSAGSGAATLVLAGVAVSSFLTAGQTFVQQFRLESLQQVYLWIMGRVSTAGWQQVLVILPPLALAAGVLCACGRLLDLLGTGDEEAAALGAHPGRVRAVVLGAASLATAAAVSAAGLVGFVGLVVPHLVRLAAGGSYRVLLPLSLLCGGAFLVLADMLARTALAPAELPLGVVTAFVGAPFLALLLHTGRSA